MRRTPDNTQPPQASASTNSAIRAHVSIADEECRETDAVSSAERPEFGVHVPDVGQEFRDVSAGDKFQERPDFQPGPRFPRKVWRQCDACSQWFAALSKKVNQGLSRFCSRRCCADHAAATGKFRGANNPRWLGGVSNDNMRYRNRQKEREPFQEAARRAVYNAVARGDLVRQPCEVCGEPKSEGHHDDYSKPLEVRWLCRRHHIEHHKRSA